MEFDLIEAIRARTQLARADVALSIGDDAAMLDVPARQCLVACTDTLVDGVHFPRGTPPAAIGWKSLAVNLSDLAAMGAEPAWALLALTLPAGDAGFVTAFADGFAALARAHGVALVGGDTTQGPLAVTVTALGFVPRDAALIRAGAQVGDAVYVTGTLGDAAAGLQLSLTSLAGERAAGGGGELSDRLNRPVPRLAAGVALRGIASACVDVSDGLTADLGHICAASGVAAEIEIEALPLSGALRAAFDASSSRGFALTGGDDYELCFTAAPERAEEVAAVFAKLDLRVTRVGRIVAGDGVCVLDGNGAALPMPRTGWEHFAS